MIVWTPTRIALLVFTVLATVLAFWVWVQTARLNAALDQQRTVRAELAAARASAGNWQGLAEDLRRKLEAEIAARQVDRERDRAAVAAAQAAQADADRTLRGWLDRYAAATRSAECAAIERLPICEVPR